MDEHFATLIERLEAVGIKFEAGLSDAEIERVQDRFGFLFPPDLRQFLQIALPTSKPEKAGQTWRIPFPNWRSEEETSLRRRLSLPLEGLLFDVERNNFWHDDWGERPDNLPDALAVAREAVHQAPVLIPIYGHRFIPNRPQQAGNPIFSVMQTDIICYGRDIPDYLANEFKIENPCLKPEEIRHIEFWSWFAFPPEPPLTLELVESKIEACLRSVEFWKQIQQQEAENPNTTERQKRSTQSILTRDEQSLREWEQKRQELLNS